MELSPGSKREAVGELLSHLLSRDPVDFNSAINASFSSSAVYSGHGLKIEGASNLKHAAWLFNAVTTGRAASFQLSDIEWSESDNSATVQTVRYVRPRFLPLVGLAFPVTTKLRFNPDGEGSSSLSSSNAQPLYVTSLEDHWPLDSYVKALPVIGSLYQALFTPIATFLVLALSNALFAGYATVTSSKRHYLDTSVDALSVRAKKALPEEVSNNVNTGFQEGTKLAQGWGTRTVNAAEKVAYPLLSTLETVSQRSTTLLNGFLPLPLPYPYIYDAHCNPSGKAVKSFSGEKKQLPAPVEPAAPAANNTAKTGSNPPPSQDTPAAEVLVAPALDGNDQGKTVDIQSRVNNEQEDEPAPAPKTGESLYDQLRKDGELPTGEQVATLAAPSHGQDSRSSEEDAAHGVVGASKKKKSGSKKKKTAASHVHSPSFTEGLHQAEESEAHAQ